MPTRQPEKVNEGPQLALPEGKYRTIVVDPPWTMRKSSRKVRPLQGPALDYAVMDIDQIKAFPVANLAAETGCQVYLWTTQRFLPAAFDVFRAWGVNYHCTLVWHKNVGFTPFSFMFNSEFCLFGHIGAFEFREMGQPSCFNAKVREHSRKPDEFYRIVRTVSLAPRIDMFSREAHEGFDTWGDEKGKFDGPCTGSSRSVSREAEEGMHIRIPQMHWNAGETAASSP